MIFLMGIIHTMNFDTRTVMDIIQLNDELKDELFEIIFQEHLFNEKYNMLNTDKFSDAISPLIKDSLKKFFKRGLTGMGLSVLKGTININNVDYDYLVNEVSKF